MSVNLLSATQAIEKTMPFVFYRWLVFLGLAFGFIFAALAGAGTAIAVFSLSSKPMLYANLGAIVGFVAFGWVLHRVWGSVELAVSIPHLLLLGKVARGETLPGGKAQLQFSKANMAASFTSSTEARSLQTSIHETLRALPQIGEISVVSSASEKLVPMIERLGAYLSGLNADAVLACAGTAAGHAPWKAARDGILAYATTLKTRMAQRGYVTLFVLALWACAYLVLLIPCQKLASALPFDSGFWPYVTAAVLSWNIKASFLDPIAQAAMIRVHLDDEPEALDQTWAERLDQASPSFREIASRGMQANQG